MGFVGLEEKELKMVRRGQVPGEGAGCEAQVEECLEFHGLFRNRRQQAPFGTARQRLATQDSQQRALLL